MGSICSRKTEDLRPKERKEEKPPKREYEPIPSEGHEKRHGSRRLCCCCGCLICFGGILVGLYFVAVKIFTEKAIDHFVKINEEHVNEYCTNTTQLTMANITENTWWPGCGLVTTMGDFAKCKGTCIKMATMQAMDAFSTLYGGQLVSYFSRPGAGLNNRSVQVIKLTGWWLPAPNHSASTPRIVLQHGFRSNSNMHRQMFAAYQLRKLGFSVLVNNLRDHCYSDHSAFSDYYQWGHAYPYDTLGAWDFAVNDPQNIMGGKIPDDKVGIMGFSMGAFLTTIALGLEGRVPAAWVDSPPFSPEDAFSFGARKTMREMCGPCESILHKLLVGPVWKNVKNAAADAGIDLDAETPAKALPMGPDTKRPIYWVGNKDDTTVNFDDGAKLATVLTTYPLKYNLAGSMQNEGMCNGGDHCEDHLRIPEQYESRLCFFWTGIFKLSNATCSQPDLAPVTPLPLPVPPTNVTPALPATNVTPQVPPTNASLVAPRRLLSEPARSSGLQASIHMV